MTHWGELRLIFLGYIGIAAISLPFLIPIYFHGMGGTFP